MQDAVERGARSALLGLILNVFLVALKIGTGLIGNSYALVADGVESAADVFASIIVWRGLKISTKSADEDFHFGYGKAETVAAAAVSVMLLVAAVGIAIMAIREILNPSGGPAAFTLVVLVGVIAVKETMFRRMRSVSDGLASRALETDAWHHRADAITSFAAFVGISLALVGGEGWAPADDWAALAASFVIAYNGLRLLRPAVGDLMDRAPDMEVLQRVREIASGVEGVAAVEKIQARRAGLGYLIAIHVQADPFLSLREAHNLGGRVRHEIRTDARFIDAFVHMEPYEHDE